MEGVNIGGMLLVSVGVFVGGLVALVALGLSIGRQFKAARITFASGLMIAAAFFALAALTSLERGMGFHQEGSEPTIILVAAIFLLWGVGQLLAAVRDQGAFLAAFVCACGSMLLIGSFGLTGDAVAGVMEADLFGRVLGLRSRSMPWINLGLALSLLLAVQSLAVAVAPLGRRMDVFLGVLLAGLGGIAGFAAGDACVTTRTTMVQGFPGDTARVRVIVELLGTQVSDEVGLARIPREGLRFVRVVSSEQAAWVYGPLFAGMIAGLVAGLLAALLMRRLTRRPMPDLVAEPYPRGPASEQIKPA